MALSTSKLLRARFFQVVASAKLRFLPIFQKPVDRSSESYKITSRLSDLEGKDEHKLEYLKTLLALGADDIRHVSLYITAIFAITLIALGSAVFPPILLLTTPVRGVLAIGIICAGFSVLFFFRYVRMMHLTRMAIARCLPSLDIRRARELWAGEAGVWNTHKRSYYNGLLFLSIGLACDGFVLVYLLLRHRSA